MQLPTLLGRTSSSLFLLAVLAAPSPADDLFVASSNTLIARGNAMSGGFVVVGGCFGLPQSIAVDGQNAFFGDPTGRIYFFDGSMQSVSLLTDTTSDARALAVRGQELLVGGSDGTIQRIHKVTAVPLGTWTVSGDVTSLQSLGNRLFVGSSSGLITELDINGGTAGFFGVCGGTATSMALDSTHLIVGTSSGFIFRMNLTTGFTDAFFDTGHDITSIVVQGGSLLTAGSEGVIRRIHRISGAQQGTMSWPFDISTMGAATSPVGLGSCYGYDCPCNNPDQISGCRNSTGVGCTLSGSGSRSVTADDLSLTATNMPSGSMGRMYMGAGTINVPFGDGLLCAGSGGYGQFRFPVQAAGPNGTFTLGPGIVQHAESHFSAPGVIVPGFTWHFQSWYRNSAGPCGSGFNTSNAFSVTFVP